MAAASSSIALFFFLLLVSPRPAACGKHKDRAPKNNNSHAHNHGNAAAPPPAAPSSPPTPPSNSSSSTTPSTPSPSSNSSSCSGPDAGGGWLDARATWYGSPNGAGPDDNGGACGFKQVNLPPFSAMTSCGNEPLFKDGKGCGSCYQIRCVGRSHPACSGLPETVVITDMNYYPVSLYHFDLSGTAFGAMAMDGLSDQLRHAGIIDIQFRRVPCQYPGLTVAFHVEEGSNPNYLAVLVEYENGDGDVVQVDLQESSSSSSSPAPGVWTPMRESWGSIWRLDTHRPLQGPFSLRITNESGKTLVADQVIPADWQPDTVYRSIVQFDD